MRKFEKKEVTAMVKKIDSGIWAAKKWRAKEITKDILTGIWTVTIFPVILIWMFITE